MFPIVVPRIFLSLRYGADLRRSRLVFLFFRQTTDLIAYVPLFTETDKITQTAQAKSGQCKLSAKGPPFHFKPFLRNLQNQKRLKGLLSQFFWHCGTFFENFLMSQKSPPFEFFDILQQNIC